VEDSVNSRVFRFARGPTAVLFRTKVLSTV
jgi:hypothetical protein